MTKNTIEEIQQEKGYFRKFREEDKFTKLEISQNYYYNIATIIEIDNSRISNFMKSPKITNSRKSKHAKITRSTVYIMIPGVDPKYVT